jgi:hypothetical protein
VPFVEQAANYLTGEEARATSVTVGSFFEIRAEGDKGASAEVFDPAGKRVLSFAEAAATRGVALTSPGYYDIRSTGRRELVAVNPDRRESDLEVVSAETLALWQNTGQGGTATTAEGQESKPWALGWYIMLGVLLVAAIESLFSQRYLAGEEAQ